MYCHHLHGEDFLKNTGIYLQDHSVTTQKAVIDMVVQWRNCHYQVFIQIIWCEHIFSSVKYTFMYWFKLLLFYLLLLKHGDVWCRSIAFCNNRSEKFWYRYYGSLFYIKIMLSYPQIMSLQPVGYKQLRDGLKPMGCILTRVEIHNSRWYCLPWKLFRKNIKSQYTLLRLSLIVLVCSAPYLNTDYICYFALLFAAFPYTSASNDLRYTFLTFFMHLYKTPEALV